MRALGGSPPPDPQPSTGRIDVDRYRCPDRFEREREILFRRYPLVVGYGSQVVQPGQFVTHDASGVPILVVRDDAMELRAFLNVCRHRGCRVVDEREGRVDRALTCAYHGWRYATDGSLVAPTTPESFPGLCKEDHGLVELWVEESCGLVFVVPTPGIEFDLDRYLGPYFELLVSLGFDDHRMIRYKEREVAGNWKLMMDANLETYHVPYLHRETAGLSIAGHSTLVDWDPPHFRAIIPQKRIPDIRGDDPSAGSLADHCAVYHGIFPCSKVLYLHGYGIVLTTFPIAIDRSLVQSAMLVPPGEADQEEIGRRAEADSTYWKTMEEDFRAVENQQRGLATGVNETFVVGSGERILNYYHGLLDQALEGRLEI